MNKIKQVKISVELNVALAFKNACIKNGVSMTKELTNFMVERADILNDCSNMENVRLSSRSGRRKETAAAIAKLEKIRNAEADYRDKIPPNLQSGPAYEAAEYAVDQIEQALDLLHEAFLC